MVDYEDFILSNGRANGLSEKEINTIMVRAHRTLGRVPEEEREKALMTLIKNAAKWKKKGREESEGKATTTRLDEGER